MTRPENVTEGVDVLQQLGLKEYEARCYAGLLRMRTGTAKQLSETTEVPRTRVYDSIQVLEAKGLVEIHHSSPQQFRAVSLDEATETLRQRHENRLERLRDALEPIEAVDPDEPGAQQLWAIAETNAIEERATTFIDDATDEIVLVLGHESLLTEDLVATLNDVGDDVDLLVGAVTESLEERIRPLVPDATTFPSCLDWLHGERASDGGIEVGRLLLVDRSEVLLSSTAPDAEQEHAIVGEGSGNGLVVLARRLVEQGPILAPAPA